MGIGDKAVENMVFLLNLAGMKHELFGVRIDDIDDSELENITESWLKETDSHVIVTPNPEFILLARSNEKFRDLLNKSDLAIADGVGLRYAIAALTQNRLKHRHTGIDLVERLIRLSNQTNRRVLLFGGLPGSAEQTKVHMQKRYPTLQIHSLDPGIIEGTIGSMRIRETLIDQIRSYHPDVLIVALGQGKQEQFIDLIRSEIPTVRIAVGVGGSFDTLSGMIPRAPMFMRRTGLEWLWRLYIEPKRIRRITNAIIVFPAVVINATLRQHKFLSACKNVIPEIVRQLKSL